MQAGRQFAGAKLFPKKVAEPMLAAAKDYDAAGGAWQQWEQHLGLGVARDDSKAVRRAWQRKMSRRAGAAAIREAAAHERAAAANVAAALAALSADE